MRALLCEDKRTHALTSSFGRQRHERPPKCSPTKTWCVPRRLDCGCGYAQRVCAHCTPRSRQWQPAQDLVFASPLSRAKYGGERVAEKHGLDVKLDDRFKEVQRGRWLGKTREEIDKVSACFVLVSRLSFPWRRRKLTLVATWRCHDDPGRSSLVIWNHLRGTRLGSNTVARPTASSVRACLQAWGPCSRSRVRQTPEKLLWCRTCG